MAILSREAIRNVQDIPTETVPVPEWGGEVIVKGLSAAQRLEFAGRMAEFKDMSQDNPDPATMRKLLQVQAEIVCCTVVDEAGKYLFDMEQDAGWLQDKNSAAMERLFYTAVNLSGLGKQAAEVAEKNS